MAGTLLLPGPHWQCPALLTWVLSIELEPLQVVGDSVLSCAPILVGVSCVAALFHAVPEEPAGAEAGECGHEVALGMARHRVPAAGRGRCPLSVAGARSSSPVPVGVLAEHGRIPHHDQQSLGPGDGHVKPLKRTSK